VDSTKQPDSLPNSAEEEEPTLVLPGWRTVRLLARGSGAHVFEVRDDGWPPAVAKVVSPELADDVWSCGVLLQETLLLASLSQVKGIAHFLDAVVAADGRNALIMKRAPGVELKAVAKHRPLEWVLRFSSAVLGILADLHGAGATHGDISMRNIIVDARPEDVTVIDFGVAAELRALRYHERVPRNLTPRFASPEQFWLTFGDGKNTMCLDHRVDLYAVGGIIYTLLHGHPPHPDCTTMQQLLRVHAAGLSPAIEPRIARALPKGFADMLAALLEPNPHSRPLSAQGALKMVG